MRIHRARRGSPGPANVAAVVVEAREGRVGVVFWPLLFLFLGVVLLIAEVFVPSGGGIGLCSILCLALCLWYAFQQSLLMGATFLLVDAVVLPLTAALAFSLWSRTPLARRVFLQPPTAEEIAATSTSHLLAHLVGIDGRTLTPLRPSGHIEFDGRRYDGVAEEGFLPAGAVVRVVRVRSGRLVVRGLGDQDLTPALDSRERIPDHPRNTDDSGALPPTAAAVSILEDPQ